MTSQTASLNMVKQQLRTCEIQDPHILDLFQSLPRHEFVPTHYQAFAYSDMQIPLPHGQRMMTPLEEASLLQALHLTGTETVLEVGTGSGFLTALLAQLSKQVISLDYYTDFTATAARHLNSAGIHNVELITADGRPGLLDKAPYDVIVFTSAMDAITETIKLQLAPGGRLFTILGEKAPMMAKVLTLGLNGEWHERIIFETTVAPLIDVSKPKKFTF